MSAISLTTTASRFGAALTIIAAGGLLTLAVPQDEAVAKAQASKIWKNVAKKLRNSVKAEAKADLNLELARALAIADEDDREEAEDDAKDEYKETKALAGDQYAARLDLAVRLQETELYDVDIDPNDFVDVIDNPFLPLTPGVTLTYEADTEDGLERIVVTVLAEKKEILGVDCTVVRDTVTLDGELIEDTYDWFAQDEDGNVWYFGEIAVNYDNGEVSNVDGSWVSGLEGAKPGIVMQATPAVGQLYRQEFFIGESEDYAEVLATGESATVPYGTFNDCLRTFDGSPMDPEALENKYYAAGIGVVLEIDIESGERVELISVTTED